MVAHVGSLTRDTQWDSRIQGGGVSSWLKRSFEKVQCRGTGKEKSIKAPGSPAVEPMRATSPVADLGMSEKDTERENGVENLAWSEREIVCPWEVL